MTAKKAPAKAKPARPARKPGRLHLIADIVSAASSIGLSVLLGWMLWDQSAERPQTTGEFATFEKRIKAEVWAKGAEKIRLQDFENARQAIDWMKAEWPRVEGEVFLPLDKEEAIAGQDLDALKALWERWSK